MTKNKKQKKLVRERAARSGIRYTTAKRSLAPKSSRAEDSNVAVATLPPAVKAALNFPLAHVLARYMKDHGVSETDAKIRDRELRRYLCLAARNPSAGWPMVPALDPLWHTFLLFTKDYQRFCQTLGVPFIHHQPFDDIVDRDEVEHRYQQFLAEYRETFGPAPMDVWPDTLANCGSECEQQCQGQCASSD